MAITNGYADLTQLKASADFPASDTADDTELEDAIEAASRAIDRETGRTFYATSATRYFTSDDTDILFVDDLLSITTLKTDDDGDRTYEATWAATDYDLEPYNSTPYTRIHTAPKGNYSFPTTRKGVEIVGSWGYCATGAHPEDIRHACILLAIRLWKRGLAPFGVLGGGELGFTRIPPLDPDVQRLIRQYYPLEVF